MAPLSQPVLQGQTYEYSSLVSKNGERFIRLLRILSKNDDRQLRCSLEIIDLYKSPVYDCLSYTWSDPLYCDLSTDPSRIKNKPVTSSSKSNAMGKLSPSPKISKTRYCNSAKLVTFQTTWKAVKRTSKDLSGSMQYAFILIDLERNTAES